MNGQHRMNTRLSRHHAAWMRPAGLSGSVDAHSCGHLFVECARNAQGQEAVKAALAKAWVSPFETMGGLPLTVRGDSLAGFSGVLSNAPFLGH